MCPEDLGDGNEPEESHGCTDSSTSVPAANHQQDTEPTVWHSLKTPLAEEQETSVSVEQIVVGASTDKVQLTSASRDNKEPDTDKDENPNRVEEKQDGSGRRKRKHSGDEDKALVGSTTTQTDSNSNGRVTRRSAAEAAKWEAEARAAKRAAKQPNRKKHKTRA